MNTYSQPPARPSSPGGILHSRCPNPGASSQTRLRCYLLNQLQENIPLRQDVHENVFAQASTHGILLASTFERIESEAASFADLTSLAEDFVQQGDTLHVHVKAYKGLTHDGNFTWILTAFAWCWDRTRSSIIRYPAMVGVHFTDMEGDVEGSATQLDDITWLEWLEVLRVASKLL